MGGRVEREGERGESRKRRDKRGKRSLRLNKFSIPKTSRDNLVDL